MPYPDDPFALKIRTSFACPACKKRALVRETKDQRSPFLGQVRCEQCGHVADANSVRAAELAAKL